MAALSRTTSRALPVAALLAAALAVSASFHTGLVDWPGAAIRSLWSAQPAWSLELLPALLRRGLDRQPSLLVAGAVAAAVPIVAILACALRFMTRLRAVARASGSGGEVPWTGSRRASVAWIELSDPSKAPISIRDIATIGSSEDCDVLLEGATGASVLALIQRTPDEKFVVFDLGDPSSSAVTVNGASMRHCHLHDGDRIEIAGSRVVFRAGDAVASPVSAVAA